MITAEAVLAGIEFWLPIAIVVGSAVTAAAHALLTRETPSSAFGWIGISLLFPPLGPLLYYMFGVNRVRIRAQRLDRASRHGLGARRPGANAVLRDYRSFIGHRRLGLAAAGDRLSAWPVVGGNRADVLNNGDKAYPPMIEAIEAATDFVYLTTYIFETNRVGQRFIKTLSRAVDRGVDVRVLIDGVGEWYAWPGKRPVGELEAEGITVARFLPPRLWPPALRLNLRNHRKILVTDGGIAFTGGMNIGDRHFVSSVGGVADMHFRLSGPIVRQIEAVFLSDWAFATGQQSAVSQRVLPAMGHAACRTIENGPTHDIERLSTLLVTAVSSAYERVLIVTPYFLPGSALVGVLQAAALRGVEVSIVLPERNNLPPVAWAAHHDLGELVARGVHVYFQPPPFAHTKLFIIDHDYALIGSPNIDPRSLRLNFELAVELFHVETIATLAAHVTATIERSKVYTHKDATARRLPTRLRDSFFWLFSPYL
ncbi:phosphatidylserine/phosphatidylglycerophosphate/cardiolipin synthase family protein [Salinisphaera sp. LB1]|uniref:phospholipase D-like domain-containing protein n=1 Tax=Salinisphaera sp. LB1 TaxID=2183911 RepID=UPI000D70545B|nr:phospholipase D-like domain-containing protein [Salinisphaera sp. LB1]AWN15206.1 Cardiolipin synthetase [Salinisphaera sp. LB1]